MRQCWRARRVSPLVANFRLFRVFKDAFLFSVPKLLIFFLRGTWCLGLFLVWRKGFEPEPLNIVESPSKTVSNTADETKPNASQTFLFRQTFRKPCWLGGNIDCLRTSVIRINVIIKTSSLDEIDAWSRAPNLGPCRAANWIVSCDMLRKIAARSHADEPSVFATDSDDKE